MLIIICLKLKKKIKYYNACWKKYG